MLNLNNCTISANIANYGGGILLSETSSATIINSTVTNNTGDTGGGIFSVPGSQLNLSNSIIAGNSATERGQELTVLGTLNASSNNLLGNSRWSSMQSFDGFAPSITNIIATSDGNNPTPLARIIAALADNGGSTVTHALPYGSPAVDAGDNTICATIQVNNLDQRGQIRPRGSACDIGAFEGELASGTSFFVVPMPSGKSVIFDL